MNIHGTRRPVKGSATGRSQHPLVLPVWITALTLVLLLAGCTLDRWAEVPPGAYAVSTEGGWANQIARGELRRLVIDRDADELLFEFQDGSQTIVLFSALQRADWPAGCPGNINATRMEVLELEVDRLTLGSLTLMDPILVRDCPPEPMLLVLMEAGPVGGSGNACSYRRACVFLATP